MHVAEGDLSGEQRGGNALYSFFRAAADWPRLLKEGQTFAVEVWMSRAAPCHPALLLTLHTRH